MHVFVAETQTCVFNTFVSSAKVLISSVKCVRPQCQKCSFPAQNVFVTSDKHVCLQWDSYLEVSSRDYLVASDEHIHLRCEIVAIAINAFVFYLEVGLTPPKRIETRGKKFLEKTSFKLGMDL